ncbi:MAG: His-Xaa-Ser system radical SAM maturase HxsB [Planctomycetes bacterium]|nr:His-Xaa-Ser system radical SAM maturase HxsB [Planctomycetota bacterium]
MRQRHLPILKPGFWEYRQFTSKQEAGYSLLPFRFIRLDGMRYVLTNECGEFCVIQRQELLHLIEHKLDGDTTIYNHLKSKHFLFDQESSVALDLLACKIRTKFSQLKELTSLFLFVVTLRCEHSCPYCQVSRQSHDKQAFDMTIEYANKAIDFVFATPSNHVKIEFQGGEPLLNFSLIQYVVRAVEERNATVSKDIVFVITTNLALVTDEMLIFCRDHHIQISTSLDGPRELHNGNRPRPGNDSYERTVSGVNLARKYLGENAVAALMTTTEKSLTQPEAIINEYVRLGFSSIFLRSLSPYGFAVKTGAVQRYGSDGWLEFYKRGLEHIFQLNLRGHRFREEYATLLMTKMFSPFPTSYVDLQSPAGAGLSCMVFNYDGSIYPSDESRMLAEMKDYRFRLGHLSQDTFQSVITNDSLLEMLSETMAEGTPMCSDCGFLPYCGSDPVYHHATQGDVVGRKTLSGFCHKSMGILRHLITILEDDPDRGRILRSWL